MEHLIPTTAIERYSAAPAPSTVAAVKSLHENIRSLLGSDYDTFLQGSYRNDTGVANINDVDIVALRNSTYSGEFSQLRFSESVSWQTIFARLQASLESYPDYRGKTEVGVKCITVKTGFRADVVPAVRIDVDGNDPIAIYSFRAGRERKNYPRVHYENNVKKQVRTSGTYKPTARMFKRWARNWFEGTKVAPSFYVECLVHSVPDELFVADGALAFFLVGHHISEKVSLSSVVMSVAGDKDILVTDEWDTARYEQFRTKLDDAITCVAQALKATTLADAQYFWRKAFNE